MTRRGRWQVVAVLGCVALLACCIGNVGGKFVKRGRPSGQESPAPCVTTEPRIHPGTGEFTFTGYPPLADHPVKVYYHAPAEPRYAQIVFVMHGVQRNADDYRDAWSPMVDEHNLLVIAPEFSEEEFPDTESYNLGNMVDSDGDFLPRKLWSFNIIEALFDDVVCQVDSTATDYAIFGHSAGAQFVHRFIEFTPQHRAWAAVAANAGWYTFLDKSVPFPYGLEDSPMTDEDLGSALASNLIVLLGADDINADDDLRDDENASRQGKHRLERGMKFYLSARETAADEDVRFAWRLSTVPEVGHSHEDMAQAAAAMLFSRPMR